MDQNRFIYSFVRLVLGFMCARVIKGEINQDLVSNRSFRCHLMYTIDYVFNFSKCHIGNLH